MRVEIFQFLVPLAFLAIWALTALLNRDAQQLPPRATGGASAVGFPQTGSMAGRAATNASASGPARYLGAADRTPVAADLKPGTRWPAPATTARDRPGTGIERRTRVEDGIVIVESEPRASLAGSGSAATSSRGARAQSTRRGGRSRSSALAGPARSAEPAKPRALSGLVNQSLSDRKSGRLEIVPLASPLVPIDLPLAQSVSSSVTGATASSQPIPAVTGTEVRSRLASANQLREIALLSEILEPPVSLRGPRRIFRCHR
ncbi:MAG: hypothetical protein ACLQIB_05005 [Isosphaeraceae bacterium]